MGRLYDNQHIIGRGTLLFIALAILAANLSCSRYGRVSDAYPESFYEIPKKIANDRFDDNPHFIIYGDNRPGWRVKEVLGKKETWLTWKQLYLPIVYQLYLVGSGVAGGVNYLVWNPDYGNSEARMVRDAVFERAQQEDADFIINTGDLVTDGRRAKDWKRFIEQNKEDVPLVTSYPYLPVSGNHDRTNDSTYGLPNFADVFSYPLFYVFECPDAAFFMLDTNYLIDQYRVIDDTVQDELFAKWFVSNDPQTPSWLERELASSDKTFKIVVMHHPPISFSEHHHEWSNPGHGNNLVEKRRELLTLFEKEGVQIVFSGHQHNYERSTLHLADGVGDEKTMQFVISGGAGSPLRPGSDHATIDKYEADYAAEGLDVTSEVQQIIYNYCVVAVTPEQIAVKSIEVSKSAETDGRVVDQFVVRAMGFRR
jgi:predicted phosphodiesterase